MTIAAIVVSAGLIVVLSMAASFGISRMFYWMARSSEHLRHALAAKMELQEAQVVLFQKATELSEARGTLAAMMEENARLRGDVREAREAYAHIASAPSPEILDDRTKKLVRLAISNNQVNEQHAAAMLVCRRLMERIE